MEYEAARSLKGWLPRRLGIDFDTFFGTKKKLNSTLPLGPIITCPGQVLVCSFSDIVDSLPYPLPSGQVRMESYLPGRKIFLSRTRSSIGNVSFTTSGTMGQHLF